MANKNGRAVALTLSEQLARYSVGLDKTYVVALNELVEEVFNYVHNKRHPHCLGWTLTRWSEECERYGGLSVQTLHNIRMRRTTLPGFYTVAKMMAPLPANVRRELMDQFIRQFGTGRRVRTNTKLRLRHIA